MSLNKGNRLFPGVLALFTVMVGVAVISSCGSGSSAGKTSATSTSRVYPMFVDANGNGINDYFEKATHQGYGHDFVDLNGDGICDHAQDGSLIWHGPGFVDNNGNGICDYWESGAPMYGQNGGMMFRDLNGNGINDYFEQATHQGYGHSFVDLNGDGICDYAQNGSASTFHGPGFMDSNGNGMWDHWESGGNGWGGMMGQGGMMSKI
jgi:hypothetical protein